MKFFSNVTENASKMKKRKTDDDETVAANDRFIEHFDTGVDDSFLVYESRKNGQISYKTDALGAINHFSSTFVENEKKVFRNDFNCNFSLVDKNVKNTLVQNWKTIRNDDSLTPMQKDVFNVVNEYVDFYCPGETSENLDELRPIYVLHAVNHVLKSRRRVLRNNAALSKEKRDDKGKKKTGTETNKKRIIDDEDDGKFRDQGFTRPKVLILTPFRYGALKIVEMMSKLLFGDGEKAYVKNRKRFYEEYGVDDEKSAETDKPRFPRPNDYKEIFAGNVDDCFRIGLSMAKKSLKLYSDFYASDVIVASPLGVRTATGAVDENEFDNDFLSSVEILILDQCDVFLMQNWAHVVHVLENLNKRPKKSHDTDFSRVRSWSLNDKATYYRQTLLFSSLNTPEMKNVFSKFCRNYDGCVYAVDFERQIGVLREILVELPQAFYRFSCENLETESDARLEFFCSKILPQYKNNSLRRTLIFVSSYFDFVRLRNFMKTDDCSFVQICEYADDRKVSRARDLFYHEKKQFLLFTERFHFYKRYSIRGIRNLIFYQLPVYPKFYGEICNMLDDQRDSGKMLTCTVIYSKFDALRLAAVVGSDKTRSLLTSDKTVHMIDVKKS